jgi:hypothetical protein
MSFYIMAFVGTAPFGSLMAGVLAEHLGAPATLALGGAACIVGALYFATQLPSLRAQVHPIYRRMGILPEIAEGLSQTSELHTPPED